MLVFVVPVLSEFQIQLHSPKFTDYIGTNSNANVKFAKLSNFNLITFQIWCRCYIAYAVEQARSSTFHFNVKFSKKKQRLIVRVKDL